MSDWWSTLANRPITELFGTTNPLDIITVAGGDTRYALKGQATPTWGNIQGTLTSQTDLKAQLDSLQAQITTVTNSGASSWGSITGTLASQSDLQTALNALQPLIATGTTGQYYRGDKSWATLDKTAVGLANVDNTTDLNKPISTATQTALNNKASTATFTSTVAGLVPASGGGTTTYLRADGTWQTITAGGGGTWGSITGTLSSQTDLQNALNAKADSTTLSSYSTTTQMNSAINTAVAAKENTISSGTTAQYWRGDKTWVALNAAAVGLGNVLNVAQEPAITAGTTAQYWRGDKTWVTLDKTAVGLANVDNTSDASKPVSTAQQTALNLKANLSGATFTGAITATNLSGTNTGDQDLTALQPKDATLTALAGLNWTVGTQVPVMTAADTFSLKVVGTATGNLLDKASGDSLYQSLDATLTALAALTYTGGGTQIPVFTAPDTVSFKVVGSATGNILDKASGDALYTPIAHATSDIGSSGHTTATNTILGRNAAFTGAIQELTPTATTAMLDTFTSLAKGVVPASGGGTAAYLRADGSWAAPAVAWGSITGTLSSQTDLQTALNAKLNLTGGTMSGALTLYQTETGQTNNTVAASTGFVQNSHMMATYTTTGGITTLPASATGSTVIRITGALTSSAAIAMFSGTTPAYNRQYLIINDTTGAHPVSLISVSSGATSGVGIPQGGSMHVYVNGTDIKQADTGVWAPLDSPAFTGTSSFTGTVTVPTSPLASTDSTAANMHALSTALNTYSLTTTAGDNYGGEALSVNTIYLTGSQASAPTLYLSDSSQSAAKFDRTYLIINETQSGYSVVVKACDTSPNGSVTVQNLQAAYVRTQGNQIHSVTTISPPTTSVVDRLIGTGAVSLTATECSTGVIRLYGSLTNNVSLRLGDATATWYNRAYTILNNTTQNGYTIDVEASSNSSATTTIASLAQGVTHFVTYGTEIYPLIATSTGGSSGIASVSADTAPALGGTLDAAGHTITDTAHTLKLQAGTSQQVQIWSNNNANAITVNDSSIDLSGVAVTINGSAIGGSGTTSNAVTFNNGGAGAASGTTFNGSAAKTISYNTLGAAPTASPTFTGIPIAPTATADTNNTQIATTGFVNSLSTFAGVTVTGGASTIAATSVYNLMLRFTGTLTSNATFSFGSGGFAAATKGYTVWNSTTGAFTLTLQACVTGPTSSITLAQGEKAVIFVYGTDIYKVSSSLNSTGTVTSVTVTQPAAGITVTNSGSAQTTAATNTIALANDLAAVEGLSTTGIVRRTATDTWSAGTAVALSELATQANNTVVGNVSGSTAAPVALSQSQLTALVNTFTSSLSGAVPASAGGSTNFLRADGTWAAPASGGGGFTNLDGGAPGEVFGGIGTSLDGGTP